MEKFIKNTYHSSIKTSPSIIQKNHNILGHNETIDHEEVYQRIKLQKERSLKKENIKETLKQKLKLGEKYYLRIFQIKKRTKLGQVPIR